MTTLELEAHLEGGVETQNIDFKGPCEWKVITFAKDILALSNSQDGGCIIIGVDDGSFRRVGVTEELAKTYDVDCMRDQMAVFADPYVIFYVDFPKDKTGLQYIVIEVIPFEEIPVICKKDSTDTQAATIYYRNKNRRVESARISNSYDLRTIIEIATARMMQRKKQMGFNVETGVKQKLDDELEGL